MDSIVKLEPTLQDQDTYIWYRQSKKKVCQKYEVLWRNHESYEKLLDEHPIERYRVKQVYNNKPQSSILIFRNQRQINAVENLLKPYTLEVIVCTTDLRKLPRSFPQSICLKDEDSEDFVGDRENRKLLKIS
jgi:hypothetical protein